MIYQTLFSNELKKAWNPLLTEKNISSFNLMNSSVDKLLNLIYIYELWWIIF